VPAAAAAVGGDWLMPDIGYMSVMVGI